MKSDEPKLVDLVRFPLTTQEGLSESDQHMIDAMNLDALHEMQEMGESLTEEQSTRLVELEEKNRIRMERARAAGIRFTGEGPFVDESEPEPQVKAPTTPTGEQPYVGDPQFRLTQEQRDRVAKGHRDMMALPNKPPIPMPE